MTVPNNGESEPFSVKTEMLRNDINLLTICPRHVAVRHSGRVSPRRAAPAARRGYRAGAVRLDETRPLVRGAMIALMWILNAGAAAPAQNDDEDAPAVLQHDRFEIQESQFDSWIFQNLRTARGAREHLETLLSLHADDVNQACRLAGSQRKKLELAGRGDITRFFDQVATARQKFLSVRKDRDRFNEFWRDIQPLVAILQAGLFNNDSLFHKTLQHVLTTQQREDYARHNAERQMFQYRARVELVVATLENALPLRDQQRQELITLMVEQTKPPQQFGQQDFYVVMWNLSQIPEGQLKPLFDDTQWKILTHQFGAARGMEQWLKQNGALAKDDE